MEIDWNILYVDSDAQSHETFASLLKNQYIIFKALSPQKCLNLHKKNEIHLTIIDHNIVKKAGIDFIITISKKHPKTIVMVTGPGNDGKFILKAINSGGIYRFIPKPWHKNVLAGMVDQALNAYVEKMSNEHLIIDLRYFIDEMKFLHKISQQISEKKSFPKLLNEIMESGKLVMNAEASSLLLYDPENKKLNFHVATGDKGKLMTKFSVDLGVGIAGWVAKNKKPLLIEDCYKDPRFSPEYDKKSKFKTTSMICVPLIRKSSLIGVMQVLNKKNGKTFSERDLTIFETLASQCAIAIENHRLVEKQVEAEALERELETAREIQEKLLPASLPEYLDIQIAAKLIPAKQVGGDYYNILKLNEKQSLFFIADVAGKGIPAALIVSTIYSCLNSYLKFSHDQFNLMTLVPAMNRVLIDSTTTTKFATCWFGLYHHDSKKLISINAGHNPPYIFRGRNEKPIELHKGGLFLGSLDLPFETEEIELKKNDVLVFFTDGVTEAWNKKEEDYEDYRLIDVVNNQKQLSAEEILSGIEKDVQKHVGNAQQSDDFTVAVLKIL